VSVVDIQGEVNAFAEDELMVAYREAVDHGAETLILNFGPTTYINSSGIGLLVTLLIRANRQGHRLFAYGLSDHYRRVFRLTKLNEAIRVYDDEAKAVAGAEALTSGAASTVGAT
jgi:anti-sigma B factor antagonist